METNAATSTRPARRRKSRPPYPLIAELVPHMVFTADPDGNVEFRNRATTEYAGPCATDGWNWVAMVHPADRDESVRLWKSALARGTAFEHESRLRRHDGEYRWHRSVARPLRDDRGRIILWVGTTTDIDERRRNLDALVRGKAALKRLAVRRLNGLRDSEKRLLEFLEHLPALAWTKDSEFRFSWVNRRFQSLHALRLDDVVGRNDFDIWPEDVARRLRAEDEATVRGNKPFEEARPVLLGDGSTRDMLLLKFPLPDRRGAMGIAGVGFDLTEHSRLEAQVRELMNRVVNAHEEERRRVAGELHDVIGQKLSMLGIELDLLGAQMADTPRADVSERLAQAKSQVQSAIASVRGLMADLRPPVLSDHGLIAGLQWQAEDLGRRAGLPIRVLLSGDAVRLPADIETTLFRIAQEALTNVVKHAKATSAEVEVDFHPGGVQLTVRDDGIGAAGAPSSPGARHGWGVPLMRERAAAAGGRLDIDASDAGTRVCVGIPLPPEGVRNT